ncbi:3-hydroxyacyl-CoA dehydrogenase family protein [Chitinophaga sp. LS1]|uniref:3-hydroxyacyl-CoA dehydrogenase family protein n=1 Tax=Chitinophaga sp. LS1 TaxID=3051176 RepID=UPI002AAC23C4|nr:3-hydroxyacyl-CoA dehydrogenase family protein [Chitinophaga sp. LS1]WPV66529.1 3-hydroxyacyl-CoA dehydrogenase family protein [Chitinophaga sp. LS1]
MIAVIGAGIMGTGIALDFALNGYNVVLIDISEEVLNTAKSKLRSDLRMVKMVKEQFQQVTLEEVLGRIRFEIGLQSVAEANFVIENIPENWQLKEQLYKELNPLMKKDMTLAINTSCIEIAKVATCFNHPDRVIGAHFMNPVPLKKMVEVIKSPLTEEDTLADMKKTLATLGKKAIVVNDKPGFVSNRVSHLYMNEAAMLLEEQVASAADIDQIFTLGYGHAMGPLATADLIGIDTVVNSLEVLYDSYKDNRFMCCKLLREMVGKGLLGRKSGEGFFKY